MDFYHHHVDLQKPVYEHWLSTEWTSKALQYALIDTIFQRVIELLLSIITLWLIYFEHLNNGFGSCFLVDNDFYVPAPVWIAADVVRFFEWNCEGAVAIVV